MRFFIGAGFGDGIDEGATAKIFLVEPVVERAGQRGKTIAAREVRLDRSGKHRHPFLVAPSKKGGDQRILRREIAIQRHFRDTRLGDDTVDTSGPQAVAVEQPFGHIEDTFARRRDRHVASRIR